MSAEPSDYAGKVAEAEAAVKSVTDPELKRVAFEKILVHLLVVDHLAEQVHALIGVFLQRFIADLYGVLHTIAKSKMTGDVKLNGTEVQNGRGKILFAQVFQTSPLLDLSGDGRLIVGWNFELFDNNTVLTSNGKVSVCWEG